MEQRIIQIQLKHNTSKISIENINGLPYTMLPVIMLKEGVFIANKESNPNGYATYYSGDILKESIVSWNGRSVGIGHPTNGESMNTPRNISHSIGYIFNTGYDDITKGLKAVVAIRSDMGADIVRRFMSNEIIDVSTGVWGTIVKEEGFYNGTKYDEYYTNIIGDHLAILPGGRGACSSEDGCGLREMSNYDENLKINNVNIGEIMSNKEECKNDAPIVDEAPVAKRLGLEELLAIAKDDIKILLNDALIKREQVLLMEKEHRDNVIAKINEYKDIKFCPKFLSSYDIETVENVSKLIDKLIVKNEEPIKSNVASEKANYLFNSSKIVEDKGCYPIKEIPVN